MIFRQLNPAEFERCLASWLGTLHITRAGRLLPIDGKIDRQSFDTTITHSACNSSAYGRSRRASAAFRWIKNSNAISIFPEVFDLVQLCEAIVTLDATGCQTEIAQQILDDWGDSMLAVERNQTTLDDGIMGYFWRKWVMTSPEFV